MLDELNDGIVPKMLSMCNVMDMVFEYKSMGSPARGTLTAMNIHEATVRCLL